MYVDIKKRNILHSAILARSLKHTSYNGNKNVHNDIFLCKNLCYELSTTREI